MPASPSPRLGLIGPAEGDAPDIPLWFQNLITQLDTGVDYGKGTLALRPVSTPSTPGIAGRIYITTDQPSGSPAPRLDLDYGTGWFTVGPSVVNANTITTAMIQAAQITEALMAVGSVGPLQLIAGSVLAQAIGAAQIDASKLAGSLFPSQGASAAQEVLRALGTGAGQAAPGTALAALQPLIDVNGVARPALQVITFTDSEEIGAGPGTVGGYTPGGGSNIFPVACVAAYGFTGWYTTQGGSTIGDSHGAWIRYYPNGRSVSFDAYNPSASANAYPTTNVTALGY